MTLVLTDRPQTLGEEIANAISHGLGLLLAIASLPILVVMAARHGTAVNIVAVCIFSVTMMMLYAVSMLYHAVPEGRVKSFLNRVDHAAIYLFIAGSVHAVRAGRAQRPLGLGAVRRRLGDGRRGHRRQADGPG